MEHLEAFRVALVAPKTEGELLKKIANRKISRELQKWIPSASANTPLEEWKSGGSAPMLIIQGADDRAASVENGLILKREFGDRIELAEIPDAGHAMIDEQPEAVLEAILRFLANK